MLKHYMKVVALFGYMLTKGNVFRKQLQLIYFNRTPSIQIFIYFLLIFADVCKVNQADSFNLHNIYALFYILLWCATI